MCIANDCIPFQKNRSNYGWIHAFIISLIEAGMGLRTIRQLVPLFAHPDITIPTFPRDVVIYKMVEQINGCACHLIALLENGQREHHGIIMAELRMTETGPRCVSLKIYQGASGGTQQPTVHTDMYVLSPVRLTRRVSNLPAHLRTRTSLQAAT